MLQPLTEPDTLTRSLPDIPVLIDLEGRVHNYELAHSKALFPVFEAVINSIHAIQEARAAGLLAGPTA